jgi:hypothetical protein
MESNIEREGLRKDKTYPFIEKKLTTLSFSLGTAYGRNDCFFDAVAQGIERAGIIIPGDDKHTGYKKLRVLCNKYFKDQQKQGDTSWLKASVKADAQFGGDNYNTCCMILQYTQTEISELYEEGTLGYKDATRGRPHIQGRILCEQFGIKLHVIEFQDATGIEGVEGNIIPVHQLVTSEGSKTVDASTINHYDSDTIYTQSV